MVWKRLSKYSSYFRPLSIEQSLAVCHSHSKNSYCKYYWIATLISKKYYMESAPVIFIFFSLTFFSRIEPSVGQAPVAGVILYTDVFLASPFLLPFHPVDKSVTIREFHCREGDLTLSYQ